MPKPGAIAAALAHTDYKSVVVDTEQLTITRTAPVQIDLSSIAKGFAVDQAATAVEALGVTNYLIEVGGEIRARGGKPDGRGWHIAVREPQLDPNVNTVVVLDNKAIATSGDYLNYYEVDHRHFSHLIDARTGYPEQHRLASVAVIHDDTSLADAWATTLMILGEKEGIRLADKMGLDTLFIYHADDGFQSASTGLFDSYRATPH